MRSVNLQTGCQLTAVGVTLTVVADVPQVINYQWQLTDSVGPPGLGPVAILSRTRMWCRSAREHELDQIDEVGDIYSPTGINIRLV